MSCSFNHYLIVSFMLLAVWKTALQLGPTEKAPVSVSPKLLPKNVPEPVNFSELTLTEDNAISEHPSAQLTTQGCPAVGRHPLTVTVLLAATHTL
jgi:hypothetical protein